MRAARVSIAARRSRAAATRAAGSRSCAAVVPAKQQAAARAATIELARIADPRLAPPGNGVPIMEWRLMDLRVRAVDLGRRPVRREIFERTAHRLRGLVPAGIVRRADGLVPVQLADLPDAVLFHILVLVRPFGPDRGLAVLPDLDQRAPSAFRGPAVVGDVHRAL